MKFKIFFLMLIATFQVQPFLIIGHRGACGYEPENTLLSFQKALDLCVDMIELDVYVCKTGELVVHHDDTVDRTTNGHGNIVDMNFSQLRSLVVEEKTQIPTLSEVIDLVAGRISINIELKGPGTAVPVAELIQKYLKNGWNEHDFVVSSFDHEQVKQFKILCPQIKVGVLFSSKNVPKNNIEIAQQCQATFIGFDAKVVTEALIKNAHEAGFLVYVWTVNDKQTADTMRSLSVDGIFSNYPDKVC